MVFPFGLKTTIICVDSRSLENFFALTSSKSSPVVTELLPSLTLQRVKGPGRVFSEHLKNLEKTQTLGSSEVFQLCAVFVLPKSCLTFSIPAPVAAVRLRG